MLFDIYATYILDTALYKRLILSIFKIFQAIAFVLFPCRDISSSILLLLLLLLHYARRNHIDITIINTVAQIASCGCSTFAFFIFFADQLIIKVEHASTMTNRFQKNWQMIHIKINRVGQAQTLIIEIFLSAGIAAKSVRQWKRFYEMQGCTVRKLLRFDVFGVFSNVLHLCLLSCCFNLWEIYLPTSWHTLERALVFNLYPGYGTSAAKVMLTLIAKYWLLRSLLTNCAGIFSKRLFSAIIIAFTTAIRNTTL